MALDGGMAEWRNGGMAEWSPSRIPTSSPPGAGRTPRRDGAGWGPLRPGAILGPSVRVVDQGMGMAQSAGLSRGALGSDWANRLGPRGSDWANGDWAPPAGVDWESCPLRIVMQSDARRRLGDRRQETIGRIDWEAGDVSERHAACR